MVSEDLTNSLKLEQTANLRKQIYLAYVNPHSDILKVKNTLVASLTPHGLSELKILFGGGLSSGIELGQDIDYLSGDSCSRCDQVRNLKC